MHRRGWMSARALFIVMATSSSACGGREPVAPLIACQAPIAVTVGSGPRPRFTWTPTCGLYTISVIAPPATGSVFGEMWGIVSDTQLIASGVCYGETPPGSQTRTPAFSVTPGTGYAVSFTGERGKPPVASIAWTP